MVMIISMSIISPANGQGLQPAVGINQAAPIRYVVNVSIVETLSLQQKIKAYESIDFEWVNVSTELYTDVYEFSIFAENMISLNPNTIKNVLFTRGSPPNNIVVLVSGGGILVLSDNIVSKSNDGYKEVFAVKSAQPPRLGLI